MSLRTPQYLPWRYMLPRDFVLSMVLAFGERVAERIFLPGLHRTRAIADPERIDSLAAFVGDVLGHNLALIWMFFLGLYTITIFTNRPIKPLATTIVGSFLMILVFVGSTFAWFAMPVPPPK